MSTQKIIMECIERTPYLQQFRGYEQVAMAVIHLHTSPREPGTPSLLHLIIAAMEIVTQEV